MVAVHILIFDEMAGFKSSVHSNSRENSWSHEQFFSANQNLPICMKTTDIKWLINNTKEFQYNGNLQKIQEMKLYLWTWRDCSIPNICWNIASRFMSVGIP